MPDVVIVRDCTSAEPGARAIALGATSRRWLARSKRIDDGRTPTGGCGMDARAGYGVSLLLLLAAGAARADELVWRPSSPAGAAPAVEIGRPRPLTESDLNAPRPIV